MHPDGGSVGATLYFGMLSTVCAGRSAERIGVAKDARSKNGGKRLNPYLLHQRTISLGPSVSQKCCAVQKRYSSQSQFMEAILRLSLSASLAVVAFAGTMAVNA